MPALERFLIAAERRIAPAVLPLLRRRRARSLRQGGDNTPRPAPAAWWGDEPRWFGGGVPPRARNRVTPLIDGEAFFSQLHAALLAARQYVYITGWCLTPHVPLLRDAPDDLIRTRLISVLSETAARAPVRILLWGGAPAVIQPTRSAVRDVARTIKEQGSGDIICCLDTTAQMSHCHHQKSVIIDGQLAFVGGIDLTTFAGDRWDARDHPLRAGVNWHDAAVLIEGEAVADVERNFRQRWEAVAHDAALPHAEPATDAAWHTPAQIVRTIPSGRYPFAPSGEFGIQHAYVELIRRAREFVYLESQYLWSPIVMDALLRAIARPPSPSFRIVIVLPARATSGKWDNDQHVEMLRKADGGRGVVEVYSLFTSGPTTGVKPFRYRPVYVHAKVGVIDDEWLIIGSANLNDRGFETDSELDVIAHDRDLARGLRVDLWSEHLGLDRGEVGHRDPGELIDGAWRGRAAANALVIQQGERSLDSSVHLYHPGRAPGAWILDEAETLTFEH
ncbi:MAG TPA: phospholipase D family protein [Dehalococcoidia bacterium]|nr:phospholipase D family protein [Dehalococcoidia bacterium]